MRSRRASRWPSAPRRGPGRAARGRRGTVARPRLRRGRAGRAAAPASRPFTGCSASTCRTGRWRRAAQRLHLDTMPDRQRDRVELLQSSLTYRDDRLAGLRRGRADGGHRARRPAAAAGAGADRCSATPGPAPSWSPRRTSSTTCGSPAWPAGRDAAPRPPVRVDPGGVPRLGRRRRGPARLHGPLPPGRDPTTPRSARRPSWRCSPVTIA